MIQYEEVVLQDSDIDTLRGLCFLSDKVIQFYFAYLTSTKNLDDDVLLVEPCVSFWLASCDQAAATSFAETHKLSTKSLVLFAVSDCDSSCEGDTGNHWSILVYHRSMNTFIHYDTVQGRNHLAAMGLYEAVKSCMGGSARQVSKNKRDKKKKSSISKPLLDVPLTQPSALPVFMEAKDIPQQSNGYDCGLYVLAIAKVICDWFVDEINTQVDLLSAVAKRVDHNVEWQMRANVLGIIQKLGARH